jgi:cell division protein FtsN
MTDREFHEIQLSGKQLVFLFISLVVLAVVTFLLGVAVGKGVRGDMMDAPTSAAAASEAVVPEEPPVQPAQELGYHDLLAGSGTPTPPAASGPPPTPPAENTPPPAPVTEPVPTPAPAPPASTAVTGDAFLQFGAYSRRQAADSQVAALKKLNVAAFVLVPSANSPDRLFRVRSGPYATAAEAEAARVRLVREGYKPEVVR